MNTAIFLGDRIFRQCYGNFSGPETPTLWQAATVPIPDIYLPDTLRTDGDSNYTQAASACLDVLQEGNFTEKCEDVSSSLKDHTLEACIRDYVVIGAEEATSVMLNALIFYCQGALEVDECQLTGFLDFCRPTEDSAAADGFMWWIIAVVVLLLLIIIVIVVVCIYMKKQKRKRLIEGGADDMDGFHTLTSKGGYFHPGVESETSFIEGRSSAWSNGRNSVDSIDSRFFESPVMFLGAPPDRFVYRDYARTPGGPTPGPSSRMSSRISGGTGSRMSGRSMSIDITVSPTPEPNQVDNSAATALATFNKNRRASSPGMSATPTEVSHLPAPLGTSVQRPKPPSQDVIGNRSLLPPGQTPHPPPKVTPLTSTTNDTSLKPKIPFGVNIPFGAVKRSDNDTKLAPAPGRHDTLSSETPSGSGNDTRRMSMPTGPSNSSVPKLAPPPGRSGSLDSNATPILPAQHPSQPLRMTAGAPTPQPLFAPTAPHSLRTGGANGTSSPWKAKASAPTLPAPSSLTARILRKSSLASTPAPDSDHKQ